MSDDAGTSPVETELDRDIGIVGAVAIGVGTMIAAVTGATLHVMNVIDPGASAEERERAEGVIAGAARGLEDVGVETAIVAETANHDLTIIGATREGLLQEFVFGAIPVRVGQRADNTVIMTKRNLGITSRLRRWLRWR